MKICLFYHSLISGWNHGNVHFLRGVTTELLKRGHDVQVFEPEEGWSYTNWKKERGEQGLEDFQNEFPHLETNFYNSSTHFGRHISDADLVIVHEWNDTDLVQRLGELKKSYNYRLLFHDTHHRSATSPQQIAEYDLSNYDGVLAFGEVIKQLYLENNWAKRAWTWHEAADTSVFRPLPEEENEGDLVWIGNWGDNERTEELEEFLIKPVKRLGLKAKMYGVRYPERALDMLEEAGIEYGGYLPSHRVPEVFAQYKFTVHIPRRAYTEALPGIPTIRPFEAMACGIPLISAPWQDSEHLFREGKDYIMVENGNEMVGAMKRVLSDSIQAQNLARHGLQTIQESHTCSHRVDELLAIYDSLDETLEEQTLEKV